MTPTSNPEEAPRSNSRRFGREAVMQYLFSCDLKDEMPSAATFDSCFELICSEEQLKKNEYWKLAGADIAMLDAFRSQVPSGDMEKLAIVSRYKQAQKLRQDALDARIGDRCFVVDKVEARPAAPESNALSDWPGHPRPAYYALMCAWQREVGY